MAEPGAPCTSSRILDASPAVGALAPALFAARRPPHAWAATVLAGRVARAPRCCAPGAILGAAGTLLGALFVPTAGLSLALVGVAVAGGGIFICAPVLFSIACRGADEAARPSAPPRS